MHLDDEKAYNTDSCPFNKSMNRKLPVDEIVVELDCVLSLGIRAQTKIHWNYIS